MKIFAYNTKKVEEFDSNRHVTMHVDLDKKIVTATIICTPDKFEEKFHKTVRALGSKFSGYTVKATLPLVGGGKFVATSRIH